MSERKTQYTVIREYENRYGQEELLRRLIRRHIRKEYAESGRNLNGEVKEDAK